MKIPGLSCPQCGGENLRRSKRQSISEIANMLAGAYPFRCLDCGTRSWLNIWMFSKLTTAKCPKCLRTDLVTWPEKYFRPTLWRRVQFTLGANRYRCHACRHNFISFRHLQKGGQNSPVLPAVGEVNVPESTSAE